MRKIFFIIIFLLYQVFNVLALDSNDESFSTDTSTIVIPISITKKIMDSTPFTHKIRHGDMLVSWVRENMPLSDASLKIVFSRLSKEYLSASCVVLSAPNIGRYLPDSFTLLGVLDEHVAVFDSTQSSELHIHPWEIKIDFLRLALYYAHQAKESLPPSLSVLRRRAEELKNVVLAHCGDPFEIAALEKGISVWKYNEKAKNELAFYAAFQVNIYQKLFAKQGLYKNFLQDLAYHMANGTVLRAASKHPLDNLMLEYSSLSQLWNRRYEALTTPKKHPLPESMARNKALDQAKFEKEVYDEIKVLTEQLITLHSITTELKECGNIFSAKLNKISGENIALKASGTAGVIEKVLIFTNDYHRLIYDIYLERFWRFVSIIGTLMHLKDINTLPEYPGIFVTMPFIMPATFERIILDLEGVKGMAEKIQNRKMS